MSGKHFTPAQADSTLPLVRRIVRDIITLYPVWRDSVEAFTVHSANATADRPDEQALMLEREVQRLAREIDACLRELASLGVEYKQPLDAGLVDFPGRVDGRDVYLCWKYDEPAVSHWHDTDAGFAGRRPLTPAAAD